MVLPSDESLSSLPVVDRDWNKFLQQVAERLGKVNIGSRSQKFLNGTIRNALLDSPNRFARIGLARAQGDQCWLMLDSLFPDRKSTRLNSSHDQISYAVFCLKKKNT